MQTILLGGIIAMLHNLMNTRLHSPIGIVERFTTTFQKHQEVWFLSAVSLAIPNLFQARELTSWPPLF